MRILGMPRVSAMRMLYLRDYAWKIMGNTVPDGLLVDSDVR